MWPAPAALTPSPSVQGHERVFQLCGKLPSKQPQYSLATDAPVCQCSPIEVINTLTQQPPDMKYYEGHQKGNKRIAINYVKSNVELEYCRWLSSGRSEVEGTWRSHGVAQTPWSGRQRRAEAAEPGDRPAYHCRLEVITRTGVITWFGVRFTVFHGIENQKVVSHPKNMKLFNSLAATDVYRR